MARMAEQSRPKVEKFARVGETPSFGVQPSFTGLSVSEATGDYLYHRHQHPHYEIIIVDRGPYVCDLNQARLSLRRGDVLVVKPGDWHQDLLTPPVRYFGLSLRLGASAEERSLPLFVEGVQPAQQVVRTGQRLFWPVLKRIREESRRADAVSSQIQDALLLELFWRLVRALPTEAVSPQFLRQSADAGFVSRVRRVFHERISQSVRVEDLAAALNISPRSLTHKCRQILHASPGKAFMRYKMERALTLLQQTDMPVKEISFQLGFKNPFHFSRAFKRSHGCPPSDIRSSAH
jgi:AraC-like DNA-binding protein